VSNLSPSPSITKIELVQLVNSIFEEEYEPNKLRNLLTAHQARQGFKMQTLNMSTGLPVRIFEVFNAYVQSYVPANTGTPIKTENLVATPGLKTRYAPFTMIAKAKFLIALTEVEDTFIAYAEDTIERVVRDLRQH
jgi:hypothetical protein